MKQSNNCNFIALIFESEKILGEILLRRRDEWQRSLEIITEQRQYVSPEKDSVLLILRQEQNRN